MAGMNTIALLTIGAADSDRLKDPEVMARVLDAVVKCTALKQLGKIHFELYRVKGEQCCPLMATQALKLGTAVLTTSPKEGLIEVMISARGTFVLDALSSFLATFSEWAWLVDFTWIRKQDGAWVSNTILDTERKPA